MEIQEFEEMPEEIFRRLMGGGGRKRTFVKMASVLQTAEARRKARGGKPNHLTVATRLVMTLEYWREYRTYLHIGHSYGVSESTAYRKIRWSEDVLIRSGAFALPVSADAISPQITELRSPLNTESQCPFTDHDDGGGTDAAKRGLHDDSGIGSTWAVSL